MVEIETSPFDTTQGARPVRQMMRILATTDLHMNVDGFDFCADRNGPPIGFNRVAGLIADARRDPPPANDMSVSTLLFDNGDGLQGTPLADVMADVTAAGNSDFPHPLMQGFAACDYTAIGLGNHDFNFGLDVLERVLDQAPCPVVCSNLAWIGRRAPQRMVNRMIMRQRIQGIDLTVGVLGFVPPEVMIWDYEAVKDQISVAPIVDSARKWVPRLRAEGCDVVIVLAHAGLNATPRIPEDEDVIRQLAQINGVSAIVAGHTHKRLPGPDHSDLEGVDADSGLVHGVPVVMAGHSGAYLGRIDLPMTYVQGQGWICRSPVSRLVPAGAAVFGTPDSAVAKAKRDITTLAAPARDVARAQLSARVGRTPAPLHSFFGAVGPDPAMSLIAAAQIAVARTAVADTDAADLPVLSATSPHGSNFAEGGRGHVDMPAGDVLLRHVSGLCAFRDTVETVVVNGAQIMDWLEHSAGLFARLDPARPRQRLLNPAFPPYNFDVLFGLDYGINPTAYRRYAATGRMLGGKNQRIFDLRYQGHAVLPDQEFVVALTSYRANGGGNVQALRGVQHVVGPKILLRDAVIAQLERDDDWPAHPWRFVGTQSARVRVDTGFGARGHLGDLPSWITLDHAIEDPLSDRITLHLTLPD